MATKKKAAAPAAETKAPRSVFERILDAFLNLPWFVIALIVIGLGTAAYVTADPQGLDILGLGALRDLATAVVALAAMWIVLRRFDKASGISFKAEWGKLTPGAKAQYLGMRIIAVALVIGLLAGCEPAQDAPGEGPAPEALVEASDAPDAPAAPERLSPGAQALLADRFADEYDPLIQAAVDRWWPDYPVWEEWKAQLYQESLLDPEAVSPVGARGLAQFMPATWAEVAAELGYTGLSPHMVEPAIEAGAYYMKKQRRGWKAERPMTDRQQLAQASYNAGFGNLLKAQKRCAAGGRPLPNLYPEIVACLPQITGHHSRETITYVERIAQWTRMLRLAG